MWLRRKFLVCTSFCWCMVTMAVWALYLDKSIELVTRRIKHHHLGMHQEKSDFCLHEIQLCWLSAHHGHCVLLVLNNLSLSTERWKLYVMTHKSVPATLFASNGSFSKAPGISASVSVTITWGSLPWGTLSLGTLSWGTLSWGTRSWSANIFRSWNVALNGEVRWQICIYVPASDIIGDNARCCTSTSTSRFSTT